MKLTPTKGPEPTQDSSSPTNPRRTHEDLLSGGGRVHIEITVPRTEIKGRMRLVSRAEASKITVMVRKYFRDLEMPDSPALLSAQGLIHEWTNEIAVRHLHVAVRMPDDESKPLASLDEWRDCDDDQIATLWEQYQDHGDNIDPFGDNATLSERERVEIETALGKRNATVLRSYGSKRLSLYMLSMAVPPAT